MKLTLENLINKHKDVPCIVTLHGPSLNPYVEKIQKLQKDEGYLRISVNTWYDYFDEKPDYWTVSNTEFTIYNSIVPNFVWDHHHQFEKDVFNKYNVPLLYNDTADLTCSDFIKERLKCDYLPFDIKHFKNRKCRDILNTFRQHYEKNKNFDFKEYGNNPMIWKPRTVRGTNCDPSWATLGGAWARDNKCCHKISKDRKTIQETLQDYTGHEKHIGPTVSVAFPALIFAVLMGCNPIYVAGMDLDYEKGYAKTIDNDDSKTHVKNLAAIGHWKIVNNEIIKDDLKILRESAELVGTELINLNKNSWFNELKIGEL
tara:strand:+ start:423 stop:1367 length:945 start_codon:yes stop_codon:yes gene_type:complete